jgi:hypothetical protein
MAVAAVAQIQAKKRLEAARKLQEHEQQIQAVWLHFSFCDCILWSRACLCARAYGKSHVRPLSMSCVWIVLASSVGSLVHLILVVRTKSTMRRVAHVLNV